MIYFEILEPIKMLSDEDKGKLLVAMLEYGRDGIVPELDGALGIAWSFVYPLIDKDGQRYDEMKLQREYAAFCKKRKRIWMPKITFDEWVLMTEDERQRAVDPVLSRNPTTTAISNVNKQHTTNSLQLQPSASTNILHPQGAIDAATAADKQVKVLGGELGKNVVFLSDEQFSDLLDRMDFETFNYYVDKLSTFIIKNNAHVKNHYETILKWWQEDGACKR
jgi:hypothetical protein